MISVAFLNIFCIDYFKLLLSKICFSIELPLSLIWFVIFCSWKPYCLSMLHVCRKPSCHKCHSPYFLDTQKDKTSSLHSWNKRAILFTPWFAFLSLFISLFNSLNHLELLQCIKIMYSTNVSIIYLTWTWLSTLWFHFPFFIFPILRVRITSSIYDVSHGHFPKHKYWVMPLTDFQFAIHILMF